MDFTGKPLRSMVYLDPSGIETDVQLEAWVRRAEAYARTLPAKAAK